jgi:hypothetical protein
MAAGKTGVLVLLGLGLLGAGFGIGILVLEGPPPARTVVVDRVAAPSAAAPAAAAAAAPEDAAAPAAGVVLGEKDREEVRALLARIPGPEIPTGTGVITGVVRTAEGAPLADVEVVATAERPRQKRPQWIPGQRMPDPDPVDAVVESLAWQRWAREARREGVTDAAGEYRIEGLADLKQGLQCYRKGWMIQPADWRTAQEARPGAKVDFKATPAILVKAEVTWSGDLDASRIQVRIASGEGGSRSHGWTPENPYLSMAPGTYTLTAVGGAGEEFRSDPQTVELVAEVEPPLLRFALKGTPCIQGRILVPEGEDANQVQVFVRRLAAEERADPALLSHRSGRTNTRREGDRYWVTGIVPGRYAAGASRSGNASPAEAVEVTVGDGPAIVDLRIPPMARETYVELTVLAPDGAVQREYQVGTGFRAKGNSSSNGGVSVVRRADGVALVPHQEARAASPDDPEAVWWVEVTSPKFGKKRGEYRRGAEDALTLRFDEPGRVDVRLDGLRGHPFEGRLRATLTPAAEAEAGRHFYSRNDAGPGADGVQTFLQVQPGEYVVGLQVESDRGMGPLFKMPTTVRSGRNEVVLKVPPLYTVQVFGAENWVQVKNTAEERFSSSAQAGPEGRAVVEGLVEGEYEFRSGQKKQVIKVPGTEFVRF